MGTRERDADRERLAILELLLAAGESRHEVFEAVWNSSNDDEARQRLRQLLNIPTDALAQVILDMQIRKLTREARDALATEISQLRDRVERPID